MQRGIVTCPATTATILHVFEKQLRDCGTPMTGESMYHKRPSSLLPDISSRTGRKIDPTAALQTWSWGVC
ncbi:hypothetical protein SBA7_1270015 [Candidatus Sulfotelmatobacter sp. SbA7]|nr:hypothetical protein SBA7_1270015 [Candidatus Sulfotelmatobacter sp. SbA7]